MQCRVIAEAYSDARKPLHELQTRGDRAALGDVATVINRLVGAVDCIRTSALDGKFVDNEEGEQALDGIITSLEHRTVDEVIKARAAFVDILENKFRAFNWRVNVPSPENDAHKALVATWHFFVEQLDALQNAADLPANALAELAIGFVGNIVHFKSTASAFQVPLPGVIPTL